MTIKDGYHWYYSWSKRTWVRGHSVVEMKAREEAVAAISAAETTEEKQALLAQAQEEIRRRKRNTPR